MAAIFVFSGFALALCDRPAEPWRRRLIVEPFVALLVSFASMWLMRYVDPRFSWLLSLSSAVMAGTFYVQSFYVLRELTSLAGSVMKRREFTRVLGLGLLGVRFPSLRRRTDDRFVERWSWAMGQPVHLQLFASDETEGFEAAQKAFAELRRVEGALSLFDDASDLCELNRHSGGLGPAGGLRPGDGARTGAVTSSARPGERSIPRSSRSCVPGDFMRVGPRSRAKPKSSRPAMRFGRRRWWSMAARVTLPLKGTEIDLGGIGVGTAWIGPSQCFAVPGSAVPSSTSAVTASRSARLRARMAGKLEWPTRARRMA